MGNRTGTLSFTMNWDSALTASSYQEDFVNEISEAIPDIQTFAYFPAGLTATARVYTFTGWVSEITQNISNEGVIELTVTIRISGAITVTTATA